MASSSSSSSSSARPRMPPYLLLLVVTFTLLGILGFQAFKERRSFSHLFNDLELKAQNLQEELQTERSKIYELQRELKRSNLHQERLNKQLLELGQIKDSVEDERKRLESTVQDKDNDIVYLKEKLRILDEREGEIKVLKEQLAQRLSNTTSDNKNATSQKAGIHIETFGTAEVRENKNPEREKSIDENNIGKDVREISDDVTKVNSNIEAERKIDKIEDKYFGNGAEVGEDRNDDDDEVENQLDVENGIVDKNDPEDA